MNLLDASGLRVLLGGREVVAGVDLSVAPGEVLGLIGPNGAGKTTILRALAGVIAPSAGTIRFGGNLRDSYDRSLLARRLAYLPQGAPCHWPLTVAAQVALGRIPYLSPWQPLSPTDFHAVSRAMAATGIANLAHRTVSTLSGGERARAMLARAFATEPDLLLADEPVAALDPAHQLRIMDLMVGLAENGGGVIVVVHDLSLAARFCDRLVLLADGRVFAEGVPSDVLTRDTLLKVYGIDAEIAERPDGLTIFPHLPGQAGLERSWPS